MRFKKESPMAKSKRLHRWHKKFVWWPKELESSTADVKEYAWLETVWTRIAPGMRLTYQYSALDHPDFINYVPEDSS